MCAAEKLVGRVRVRGRAGGPAWLSGGSITCVHTTHACPSQALVELGFRMATGSVEALKPAGVRLLRGVLRVFGGVEDPLLPGGCSWFCAKAWIKATAM